VDQTDFVRLSCKFPEDMTLSGIAFNNLFRSLVKLCSFTFEQGQYQGIAAKGKFILPLNMNFHNAGILHF
jgi:hypothetical protein